MKYKLIKTEIYNYLTKKVIDTAYFERLTGWKDVKNTTITKKHPLFEYATDENGYTCNDEKFDAAQKWYYLDYIEYKGYKIPLSNCANMFNPVWYGSIVYRFIEHDETCYIDSYDLNGNIYNPLFFEFSPDGYQYRVYEQKGVDHIC